MQYELYKNFFTNFQLVESVFNLMIEMTVEFVKSETSEMLKSGNKRETFLVEMVLYDCVEQTKCKRVCYSWNRFCISICYSLQYSNVDIISKSD